MASEGYDEAAVLKLVRSWARSRSLIEREGSVEAEGWVAALDLERALGVLANLVPSSDPRWGSDSKDQILRLKTLQRDGMRAAMLLGAMTVLGYSIEDCKRSMGTRTAANLLARGIAWCSVYLSSGSLADAEAAFDR